MKKILILGAGLISRPLVNYLLQKGHFLTVADIDKSKVQLMIGDHANAIAIGLDVQNEGKLDTLVADHDIIVSLLPNTMHLLVVHLCIEYKKSMITTSYQSPGMIELKQKIEESGIIVLNEMGLDPGLDHMSAKQLIDRVHEQGGKVLEFYSICGALPAPDSVDNPFNYKFTWSPRGVMMASTSNASYLNNNEEVTLDSEFLFHNPFKVNFPELGVLDVYPNRDSLSYIEEYGLKNVKTMMRGTLRLPGWCESLDAMKALGLLDTQNIPMDKMSYFNLLERKVGTLYPEYKCQIAKYLKIEETSVAIKSLEWLGYFSNTVIERSIDSPFNVTCDLMFSKMLLKESDMDMVVLRHELLVRYPDDREERIISSLIEYGSPQSDTAIARTVALPAAIAVDLILTGEINLKGLHRPFLAEIYQPVLNRLQNGGISLKEEIIPIGMEQMKE